MNLSIITINYNDKAGLEKTIQSVISQTISDYEFIVVDGGSTDGSADVIQKYIDHLDYWVSEPDKGIYQAMNKGIRKAQGKYLHFLNSGDSYFSNDVIEYFTPIFNTTQQAMIRGNIMYNYVDGKGLGNNGGDQDVTFYQLFTSTIDHQATFIKRDLFEKYGLYDENYKIVSDWIFFSKLLLNNETSIYYDKTIVNFDMQGFSMMNFDQTLDEKRKAMETLLPCSIIQDYQSLETLKKEKEILGNDYLYKFMKENKLPQILLKILCKIYLKLNIYKL